MTAKPARLIALLVLVAAATLGASRALAHCDGLDGPVVGAAREALESGDVAPALIWVRAGDEAEIRAAFDQARDVRKLGGKARALADRYFFETLVRIHRMGEGAAYTGLKPAGRDLGPAIPAADKAIVEGSDEALARLLAGKMREGLGRHFHEVMERKDYAPGDVAAGRAFVQAYVPFLHYVEELYETAARTREGHSERH